MNLRGAVWYLSFLPILLACSFGGGDTSSGPAPQEAPARDEPPRGPGLAEEPPSRDPQPPALGGSPGKDTPFVKIFVTKSGTVTLNGREETLDGVGTALDGLKAKGGVALYSREAPEEYEPHPIALKILDMIMQRGVTVRLCQRTDCSDAIGSDGKLSDD